jgi:hypothetical protein
MSLGLGLGLGVNKTAKILADSFLPTQINNLELWLMNGQSLAVNRWGDESGNSNHASQGTSANQATIADGGLDFRAASEHFYTLADDIVIAERGSVNIFAVVEFATNANKRSIVGTGANQDFMEIFDKNTLRFHFDNSGSAEKIQFSTDHFVDQAKVLIHSERIFGATGTLNTQINGSTVTGTNTAGDGADPGTFTIDRIGTRNGDRFMNGKILELLIYKNDAADMDDADIVLVNDYLTTKFSL